MLASREANIFSPVHTEVLHTEPFIIIERISKILFFPLLTTFLTSFCMLSYVRHSYVRQSYSIRAQKSSYLHISYLFNSCFFLLSRYYLSVIFSKLFLIIAESHFITEIICIAVPDSFHEFSVCPNQFGCTPLGYHDR